MRFLVSTACAICLSASAALADDVTDAIESALSAYGDGDVQYTIDELNFALQLLNEMKAGTLEKFLPEPLSGWTREIDEDMATGMGMLGGGGVGTSARYSSGSDEFEITLMADNPMVTAMAGMLSNTAMIAASGGKMVRVGREKFIDQDGELTGLIGNRVLVQASGDNQEAMIDHLKSIDFRALAGFGN